MAHIESGKTPQQQQALKLKGEYQRFVDEIRSNRTLSEHGKQKELAILYIDYKPRMEALEAEETSTMQTRTKPLRRDLLGLSGFADLNAVNPYGDVQDRAANIQDEDAALSLLNKAELSGETSLAKAVAAKAFDVGWNRVINEYAEANPASAAKFNELINPENHGKGSAGLAQILSQAMTYSVDKPSEPLGYSLDTQIVDLGTAPARNQLWDRGWSTDPSWHYGLSLTTTADGGTTFQITKNGTGNGGALSIVNKGTGASIAIRDPSAELFAITAGGVPKWTAAANQQTTVGATGSAAALSAQPAKYLKVHDSAGNTFVVPAYNAA